MTTIPINPTLVSHKYDQMLLGYRALFVYGTLKSNFHNHNFITQGDSIFVSEATSVDKLVLYNCHSLPYVRYPLEGETGNHIKGELYGVKDLSLIDHLEGAPTHYHQRRQFFKLDNEEHELMAIIYHESHIMSRDVEELTEWTYGRVED